MRNADAIVEILGFFNNNNNTKATRRHHPHVELVIELGTQQNPGEPGEQPTSSDPGRAGDPIDLFDRREPGPDHDHDRVGGCAITTNGRILDSWATDAFLCDCVIHTVLRTSAGKILDYGRSHHTVPPRLWKAVAVRDRGCRFPGCNRKKAWTDAHHIRWWRRHGETKLENLILLCQRHHHLVHKFDWQINLDADTGRATFTLPNGRILISEPPGQPTIRAA